MRPAANFTLHAILAACLAALAASSAAAMGAARFSLTIDGYEIDSGGSASVKRQEFDITGYRFGPTRAAGSWAKADGLDVSWDIPEPRSAGYAPANSKYKNVKMVRPADSAAPVGGVTVGAGDINNAPAGGTSGRVSGIAADPAEPTSGPPTGKRMHEPVVLSRPLDRGSVMVRGSFPGCTVGKRYAGAQFAGGGMQYDLRELVVVGCSPGVATLNYAKVKVRGWDPEKKEE